MPRTTIVTVRPSDHQHIACFGRDLIGVRECEVVNESVLYGDVGRLNVEAWSLARDKPGAMFEMERSCGRSVLPGGVTVIANISTWRASARLSRCGNDSGGPIGVAAFQNAGKPAAIELGCAARSITAGGIASGVRHHAWRDHAGKGSDGGDQGD